MRPSSLQRRGGFTLVEILVVICIITILMALLVVLVVGMIDKARTAKTVAFIETLNSACENYKSSYHVYPSDSTYHDSANLHFYLGKARREVIMQSQDEAPLTAEKPAFIEFTIGQLKPGAHQAYPDPPSELIDAWNNVLHYKSPGHHNKRGVDIWSDGPKEKIEEDDVTNWHQQY